MEPTYEKIDQLRMKKLVTQEVILDVPALREKKRDAVEARNRFLAEAATQDAIIADIDKDLSEGQKIGVSESIDIGDPIKDEGSPAPKDDKTIIDEPLVVADPV